jgi:hypothetical protein
MLPASALRDFAVCAGLPCAVMRHFLSNQFCADARKQLRAFSYYERICPRTIFKELC